MLHYFVAARWDDGEMANLTKDLFLIADTYGARSPMDEESSTRVQCSFCGGDQMIVVATTVKVGGAERPFVRWLRCVSCCKGAVQNGTVVSPSKKPLDTPNALQDEDLAAWEEVRACLSVGANTAAVMMCRKLLFHVAVAHGLPEKDSNGRAPDFAKALKHLEDEGVFTKRMRPWIDKIKDVGNEANHELPTTTGAQAMDVALFTRQLINLAYELPAMVAEHAPADDGET
jgi:hypothetical protein